MSAKYCWCFAQFFTVFLVVDSFLREKEVVCNPGHKTYSLIHVDEADETVLSRCVKFEYFGCVKDCVWTSSCRNTFFWPDSDGRSVFVAGFRTLFKGDRPRLTVYQVRCCRSTAFKVLKCLWEDVPRTESAISGIAFAANSSSIIRDVRSYVINIGIVFQVEVCRIRRDWCVVNRHRSEILKNYRNRQQSAESLRLKLQLERAEEEIFDLAKASEVFEFLNEPVPPEPVSDRFSFINRPAPPEPFSVFAPAGLPALEDPDLFGIGIGVPRFEQNILQSAKSGLVGFGIGVPPVEDSVIQSDQVFCPPLVLVIKEGDVHVSSQDVGAVGFARTVSCIERFADDADYVTDYASLENGGDPAVYCTESSSWDYEGAVPVEVDCPPTQYEYSDYTYYSEDY